MTSAIVTPTDAAFNASQTIGGTVQTYGWRWENQAVNLVYETLGEGDPLLLLPALSTVSTRGEMRGLAARLADRYRVVAVDWLGFGQSDCPAVNYTAALYHQLLQDFVKDIFSEPVAVIAAGHATGYVMRLVQQGVWSQIVLVAPTWRGPLRVMGLNQPVRDTVRQLVRSPLLGQALYWANTTPEFLRLMYSRHVYSDQTHLTPEFIAAKRQVTQHPGARYAPAAFVTGTLDPVSERAEFLALFQSSMIPTLVILADHAPPSSKAEMEAITQIPGVQAHTLPGTLGLHEEYASDVVDAVLPFLAR